MTTKQLHKIILLLCAAGYAWIALNLFLSEHFSDTGRVCIFKSVTHIPCPSCGTTRAITLLADGKLAESFLTNPLGILAALFLAGAPAWIGIDILRKKNSFHRAYLYVEMCIRSYKTLSLPLILLIAINWWWNIAKGP